jgi:hypothetical protein
LGALGGGSSLPDWDWVEGILDDWGRRRRLAEDLEMRGWMRGGRMSSKRSPDDVDVGDVELEAWRRESRRGLTDAAERRAVRTIRGVVDDIVTDYYDRSGLSRV